MKIKIGTRKSQLAVWQAQFVEYLLKVDGIESKIIPIDTKGDKKLDVAIADIGSKGVFTEELEEMLANGDIDIAVHSAKDLQSNLNPEFEIISISKREKAHDVLISFKKCSVENDEPLIVGTSSTRRKAILKNKYPHIKPVSIRGNLQTRLNKLGDKHCDALMLAYAGVYRMKYDHLIQEEYSLDVFTPAVGQGSLALEASIHLDKQKRKAIRSMVNHRKSELNVCAERAFLKRLEGGCSIPAFAHAITQNNEMKIIAGLYSLDGSIEIRKEIIGKPSDYERLGDEIAGEILRAGGEEILAEIKKEVQQ